MNGILCPLLGAGFFKGMFVEEHFHIPFDSVCGLSHSLIGAVFEQACQGKGLTRIP
jgi:hypothetical protein